MKSNFGTTARLLLSALALSLGLCGAVAAQETTARISGQVTDQAGAVVTNAEVTLKNIATGEERKVNSDESGSYLYLRYSRGYTNLPCAWPASRNPSIRVLSSA